MVGFVEILLHMAYERFWAVQRTYTGTTKRLPTRSLTELGQNPTSYALSYLREFA